MITQVKEFKYAQPFFIELSCGRVLDVPTPDHLTLTERGAGRVVGLNESFPFPEDLV
jgi:hypothetical protein